MGFSVSCGMNDFLKEASHTDFSGKRILTLGKLVIAMNISRAHYYAYRMGIDIPYAEYEKLPSMDCDEMDMYDFFKMFGFAEVHAMDISPYEGADIIFDLNQPTPPCEYLGYFDYIIDGGTIEHCFNLPNALKNIISMLRVGGKVFHYPPANNMMEHGFYQLSSCLLTEFYRVNGCKVEDSNVVFESKEYQQSRGALGGGYSATLALGIDCRFFDGIQQNVPILKDYRALLRVIACKERNVGEVKEPFQVYWYGDALKWNIGIKALGLACYNENEVLIYGTGKIATKLCRNLLKVEGFKTNSVMGLVNSYDTGVGELFEKHFQIISKENLLASALKVIVIATWQYEDEIYNSIVSKVNHDVRIVRLRRFVEF